MVFFVFEREIASYIPANSNEVLEASMLPRLARDGELVANLHFGFWKPMDTLREKKELEALIESGGSSVVINIRSLTVVDKTQRVK